MELAKIEKLIEKYLEAETSLAEEQQLSEYFAQAEVAPHLAQYQVLFGYFAKAKEERFTKPVPLKPKKRTLNLKWVSVAAVAVLMVGAYLGNGIVEQQRAQERKEALAAYEEAQEAFELLAFNYTKGTEKIAYLNEFENAKGKIFKNEQ